MQDLQNRWRNTFKLFDTQQGFDVSIPDFNENGEPIKNADGSYKNVQYNEKKIEEEKKLIIKDFLFILPKFGTVVLRSRRNDFQKRIDLFEKRISAYKEAVKSAIESELTKSIKSLVNAILPMVKNNLPTRYTKGMFEEDLSDDELMNLLEDDLKENFGHIDDVFNPKVKVLYKDVSYESIHDQKFHEALGRVMHKITVEKLFSEHHAAPEQTHQAS